MKLFAWKAFGIAFVVSSIASGRAQPVIINEIMYHPLQPALGPEPTQWEYIELYNTAATNVSLAGWSFAKGVNFTFPAGASIPAGGYAVAAADATALDEKYPSVNNVYGNWVGSLANGGETIELRNAAGDTIDSVGYSDGGDWGMRQRSPSLAGIRGWIWTSPAAGGGRSLERRNPLLSGDYGQNWLPSTGDGTPGAVNSARSTDIPPMILDVTHAPLVPKSTEPVTITARLVDELTTGLVVNLQYRTNLTATPTDFTLASMFDDGQHGDGAAGDRIFGVVLPPMPNNTLIEFYVQASDRGGSVRTWPGPTYAAADQGGAYSGQQANAAFQVDDTVYPLVEPLYKLIITPAEQAVLQNVFNTPASDAEVNATILVLDGTGVECRYLCGVRNRGNGSRSGTPHNHRLNFPDDRPWHGVTSLNVNARVVPAQVAGSQIAQRAGAAGANVHFARLLVNNADSLGGRPPDGLYAANEAKDGDWSDRIFPENGGGNVYLVQRNVPPPNFDYRGALPASYRNTYFKQSNVSADDWSDMIAMLEVMGENRNAQFTMARARGVINVEQWLLHLGLMSMFGNNESGVNTGNNDDYYLYSGTADRRFLMIYHDLDTVLGLGGAKSATDGIFGATQCCISGDTEGIGKAMNFFMHHPEVEPLYYRTLQDLIDGPLSATQFNAAVDTLFANYPSLVTTANSIKSYMATRRTTVQGLINGLVPPSAKPPTAVVAGTPRAVTPVTGATLTVGGEGVTHYRYRLNSGAYGAETAIGTPITLAGLANGSSNVVSVIAKNANNVWQSTNAATVVSWLVNTGWPGVRLNEVLARNDSAVPHEGTFPDIVELFNEGSAAVNLAGYRLTDDLANSNKFVFPAGTQLAAGAYLVVYADSAAGTSGLHLGFALGENGDALYLLQPAGAGGTMADSVEFGLQIANRSIGRYGTSGDWVLSVPTPGLVNQGQTLGDATALRINEWFAASQPPLTEDYVELHNPGVLPVAAGGLYLSDEPLGLPTEHRIAPLSFLDAGEFFAFVADGQASAGAEHLNFRLTSAVGSIGLFSATMHELDYVIYTPQRNGVSMGRCPDGGVTNVAMALRTPGAPNYCPTPPPPAPPPVLVPLLPISATWRYLQSTAQNNNLDGVNWISPVYDDSAWPSGQAVLGVGSSVPEPVRTPLTVNSSSITYYFRTTFTVPADFHATSLQFSNVIDDGAVFYLNGREVARYNMPTGPVLNQTPPAQGLGGPPPWTGPIVIAVSNVSVGLNTLALEVHNASPFGDVFMGTRLDGVIVTNVVAAGALVINEVMADNRGGLVVEGKSPDWVEFYNPTTSSIDMGGMSLSDRLDDPAARWVLPAGSVVPAGGYLVIYADPDLPVSTTNAGFGFNAKGGGVYLFNRAPKSNEVLDFVEYGLQTPDHSLARVPSGGAAWVLGLPTPGLGNAAAELGGAASLRVNEWMAEPASGDDWFEIYNPGTRPVALAGLGLSDTFGDPNPYRIPALSFVGVGSNAFVQFVADNPATPSGPEHVNFKLGKDGDSIFLLAAGGGPQIDAVTFGLQALGVSQGRLPDGGTTIVSFPESATPEESNFLPLTTVVVNEVLTHTDLPLEDAIELRNLTAQSIDLSGWWLSDSKDVLRKYQIPAGTVLPASGYQVFYEHQFNNDLNAAAFSLSSADGDQVYLSQTAGGNLTGYRAIARFGPAANGVSFGRYVNSVGSVDYPPLSALTFGTAVTAQSPPDQISVFRTGTGAPNAYPKAGPIVISEIMYHPPDVGTNDNVVEEFIELRNTGSQLVPLYDPAYPTNGWRLRDAISFAFNSGHAIAPGGHLLVVSFDPVTNVSARAEFEARYGTNFVLAGPYAGKLDNSAESVELVRPDLPQVAPSPNAGFVPYLLVEKVVYADRAPWPTNADGHGFSLQRVSPTGYANDPTNWVASAPTPGPSGSGNDSDADGMPDDWEVANGFNPNDPADAGLDADADGLSNRDEYLAGTNPRNAASGLRLAASGTMPTVSLRFEAVAGRTYTVLYSDTLPGAWQRLQDVPAQPASGAVTVTDGSIAVRPQRFYRLVSPAAP